MNYSKAPCFIADETLGKLVRYLRMSGFDCKYLHSKSSNLILSAIEENRVLLTRKRQLLDESQKWSGLVCFDPASDHVKEQLFNVMNAFNLDIYPMNCARCPRCNHLLEKTNADSISADIPDYILKKHSVFLKCTHCNNIYWAGSHVERFYDDQ